MIDKLVLHIPFKDELCVKFYDKKRDKEFYHIDVRILPLKLSSPECFIDSEGKITVDRLATRFESIPSSFASMALKCYPDGQNSDAFVSIKCSPSKLIQGHNVYGINCWKKAARNMLSLLAVANSKLFDMLDVKHTQVSEFDITYSTFINNPTTKRQLLDYLSSISQGQTSKRGSNYSSTCYYGSKKTRLKSLKIYSKHEEVQHELTTISKIDEPLRYEILEKIEKTEYCKNAVRFEATIKKRYLQRRGIPVNLFEFIQYTEQNQNFNKEIWTESFKDIFKALEGQEMKYINDELIYQQISKYHSSETKNGKISLQKVNRVFSFYQSLKTLGYYHLKGTTNRWTFRRSVAELEECGFSRAYLQNLTKEHGLVVTQIAKIIKIDFSQQHPADYKEADDLRFAS